MSQKLVMMRNLGFDQEYSLPDNCKATIEDGNTLCIYQEVPDPWTGEGLPPVGTVCEYQNSLGSWFPIEITAIAKKGICFVQTERDGENYVCQVSSKFRPIRTTEQIERDQIDSEAEKLFRVINPSGKWHKADTEIRQRYLAAIMLGYRKFEIVENEE